MASQSSGVIISSPAIDIITSDIGLARYFYTNKIVSKVEKLQLSTNLELRCLFSIKYKVLSLSDLIKIK